MTLEMTTQAQQDKRLVLAGFVGFLGVFAGLCALLALVVTVVQAWQGHAEAGWPEVTARVDRCYLHQSSTGRRDRYYIDCSLGYTVGAEQAVTHVYSANAPSREVPQYPPNQIAPLEEWVASHPPGTPIALRYDPANHQNVALVVRDMPRGAQGTGAERTPSNLKQLGFWAAISIVLLAIARIAWPRSAAVEAS